MSRRASEGAAFRSFVQSCLRAELEPKLLELRHVGGEGDEQASMQSWDIGDVAAWNGNQIDSVVKEALELANADAEGAGGVRAYVLTLRAGDDERIIRRSPTVRLSVSGRLDVPTESPTSAGLVAMSQRHLENVMRTQAQTDGRRAELNDKLVERLMARCEMLEGKHFELLQLVEKFLNETQERELAAMMAKHKAEVWEEGARTLLPMFHLGLNELMGRKLFDVKGKHPVIEAVMGVFGCFGEKDWVTIASNLPPDKAAIFMNAAQQVRDFADKMKAQEDAERAKKKSTPNGQAEAS